MAEESGRSYQQGTQAAASGMRGAARAGRAAGRGAKRARQAATLLPWQVWAVILGIVLLLLLISVLVGGTSSSSMNTTHMLSAENEDEINIPETEEDMNSVYTREAALDQTSELAAIIEKAKAADRASIEAKLRQQYADKNVTIECDSDTMPILVCDDVDGYGTPYIGTGGAGGSVTSGASPAAQAAIAWATKIANDDSYTYGKGYGGYFTCCVCAECTKASDKKFTCMPFLAAAYAHGSNDPYLMKNGKHKMYLTDENFEGKLGKYWYKVGKCKDLEFADLQPGDCVVKYASNNSSGHVWMYGGEDKVIEAVPSDIRVVNGAKKKFKSYKNGESKTGQGDLNYVMRFKGTGGEVSSSGTSGSGIAPQYTKQTKLTVLETISSDTGTRHSIGYVNGTSANCAQSFAYVGGNFGVAFATCDHAPSYVQFYDKDCKYIDNSRKDSISHANAACETPEGDLLVAGSMNSDSVVGYRFGLNKKNEVEYINKTNLPNTASSIAYDRDTGKYILATSTTFRIYDKDLNKKEASSARSVHSKDYCQDIAAAGGYIFACHTVTKGSENSGENYIDVYNEESGDYCGSYMLDYGELESCDVIDGELVLLVHILGYINYIQFTGITVASDAGGGVSSFVTPSDMDILSAYSMSLSNNELKKTDGEEEEVSGSIFSSRYIDINGKRIMTYWFGKNKNRINYVFDLSLKAGRASYYESKVEISSNGKDVNITLSEKPAHKICKKLFGLDPNEPYINAYTPAQLDYLGANSPEYVSPADSGSDTSVSGSTGSTSSSAQDVIDGACAWAEAIAADNSFHYGNTKAALSRGCYFCGTQPKSKKNIPDYEKTYCCNTFVFSAFAHGGGDSYMLKMCQKGKNSNTAVFSDNKHFKRIGKPSFDKLQKGDVLYNDQHWALYLGDKRIAEAMARDDGKKNSKSWNNSIHVKKISSVSGFSGACRYIGSGGAAMNNPGSQEETSPSPSDNSEDSELEDSPYITNADVMYSLSANTSKLLYTRAVDRASIGLTSGGLMEMFPLPEGTWTQTDTFGSLDSVRGGRRHAGVDLAAREGTPIYAASTGTIKIASWYGGYGNCVVMQTGAMEIYYGHMSRIEPGIQSLAGSTNTVLAGTKIGEVGSTGNSTGPHLHFEVRINGVPTNPAQYLGNGVH